MVKYDLDIFLTEFVRFTQALFSDKRNGLLRTCVMSMCPQTLWLYKVSSPQ